MSRPLYIPRLAQDASGGWEQTFTATQIVIESMDGDGVYVGFADEGTVHYLSFIFGAEEDPDDRYCSEFCDQGGEAWDAENEEVLLGRDFLRLRYAATAEIYAGRVSYDADADILEDADPFADPVQLRSVLVTFETPLEKLDAIARELRRIERHGTKFVYEPGRGL